MPQTAVGQPAPARNPDEPPQLATAAPDAAAEPLPRFFSHDEFAALRKLGQILVPAAADGRPGAEEAKAAAFLDFLLGQSPADRQTLYRDGLRQLNEQARARHAQSFAALTAAQAAPILAPLAEPWTYSGPADPFARFLRAAQDDFLQATVNSRQWAQALFGRSRGAGGMGTYWFPLES